MHSITSLHIDASVFGPAPDFTRTVVVARVRRPALEVPPAVAVALSNAHAFARDRIGLVDGAEALPEVVKWTAAFRAVGINPSKFRPSTSALLQRVGSGAEVRSGRPLVDAGLAVSLAHGVAVGVHVLDGLAGRLELVPAQGTERFVGLDGRRDDPAAAELVWRCGDDVLTRRWAWRQGEVGSVTPAAEMLAINVDSFGPTPPGAVAQLTELLAACGAEVVGMVALDAAVPEAELPAPTTDPLLADLHARGLLAACTDEGALAERIAAGRITLYCGFDPTAPSLHVGSLLGLVLLRRFQRAGHRPILVIGGATGRIGDPSGRRSERSMLDDAVLDANRASLRAQIESLLSAEGGLEAPIVVDNLEWTAGVSVLTFLRDVGRHFRVGDLLARDSVRSRLDSEQGISFTEFSYGLLQAFDFEVLRREHDCVLQVGGSDQWGNIVAGIDLIRRTSGQDAFGLTWPLLVRADGEKFGKSSGMNVWLDGDRTSAWQFWQFWMNQPDDDAGTLIRQLSLRNVEELDELVRHTAAQPSERLVQRALADELTQWVHGDEALARVHRVASVLFGDEADLIDGDVLGVLRLEIPTVELRSDEVMCMDLAGLVHSAGVTPSRSSAARLIASGGLTVGSRVELDPSAPATALIRPGATMLRRGRRHHHLVVVSS